MGLFKKIKKIVKGTVRNVENFAHRATGQPEIGKKEPAEPAADTGLRSAAAKRLVSKSQQAGGGQISFNTEEEV